ncbi:nucleotidyltransferase family protein [Porticoccus sp.]|uniref:nucleotidyltransferase family protein n=1 Tax=Porticoccus sp. TaxID=2024853 RepID=UPI003F69FA11
MLTTLSIEELSLKLCLAEDAVTAGELQDAWDQTIVIDTMSFGIMRLSPLIHHQTQRFGLSSIHQARLKILYQYWWIAYQHRTHQLEKVVNLFAQQAIPVMALKGVGLADYYPQRTLRSMADMDLLVAREHHARALKLLLQNGWAHEYADLKRKGTVHRFFGLDPNHGVQLVHPQSDVKLDLHRRLGSYTSDRLTQLAWAQPAHSAATGLLKPARPIELFMVVLHAVMGNFEDNLNWLVDLAKMSKSLTAQDWQEAHELAIAEKKETLFLAGINIAVNYGIDLPQTITTAAENSPSRGRIPRFSDAKPLSAKWIKETIAVRYTVICHRFPDRPTYRRIAGFFAATVVLTLVYLVFMAIPKPAPQTSKRDR